MIAVKGLDDCWKWTIVLSGKIYLFTLFIWVVVASLVTTTYFVRLDGFLSLYHSLLYNYYAVDKGWWTFNHNTLDFIDENSIKHFYYNVYSCKESRWIVRYNVLLPLSWYIGPWVVNLVLISLSFLSGRKSLMDIVTLGYVLGCLALTCIVHLYRLLSPSGAQVFIRPECTV